MNPLRFELLKLCHHEGREPHQVIERASAYENWISEGDKAAKPRPTLTAGKTAKVEADPNR